MGFLKKLFGGSSQDASTTTASGKGVTNPISHKAETLPSGVDSGSKATPLQQFVNELKTCDPQFAIELVKLDAQDFNEVVLGARYDRSPSNPRLHQMFMKLRSYMQQGKISTKL